MSNQKHVMNMGTFPAIQSGADANLETVLWDERKVSEVTTLSLSTLRKMRHFRRGPAYHKIGNRVVYAPRDVWDYVFSKRVDPNTGVA